MEKIQWQYKDRVFTNTHSQALTQHTPRNPRGRIIASYALTQQKSAMGFVYNINIIYFNYGKEEHETETYTSHIDAYARMDKLERTQRMRKALAKEYLTHKGI